MAQNYLCTFFTFCKLLVLTKSEKSYTGNLHTGWSLGFGATGAESDTSSVEVVKPVDVVSSTEVTVEVMIVAFDEDDNNDKDGDDGASIVEGKGEDI